MPKINQKEYEILKKKQRKGHKYIAREKEGHIIVFTAYHGKSEHRWLVTTNRVGLKYESLFNSSEVFQFIQWTDEEPYEIAELIEEYEGDQLILAFAKEGATLEIECGCEETEVKDLEWLKDEVWNSNRNMGLDWKEFVLNKLDQLDEPEILSLEKIDKVYKEGYDKGKEYGYQSGYSVGLSNSTHEPEFTIYDAHDKIREESTLTDKSFDYYWNCIADGVEMDEPGNLLVPKQEISIRDVRDRLRELSPLNDELFDGHWNAINYGEEMNEPEITEEQAWYFIAKKYHQEGSYWFDARNHYLKTIGKPVISQEWFEIIKMYKENETELWLVFDEQEIFDDKGDDFARAWLAYPDIEIEQEPRYYVINKENELLLSKNNEGDVITYSQDYEQAKRILSDLSHYQFTEQEIKGYDPRYWAFREPVKELEE